MRDEPDSGQFENEFSTLSPEAGNFCSQGVQPAKRAKNIARKTGTAAALEALSDRPAPVADFGGNQPRHPIEKRAQPLYQLEAGKMRHQAWAISRRALLVPLTDVPHKASRE